jgi:hypothetical protein
MSALPRAMAYPAFRAPEGTKLHVEASVAAVTSSEGAYASVGLERLERAALTATRACDRKGIDGSGEAVVLDPVRDVVALRESRADSEDRPARVGDASDAIGSVGPVRRGEELPLLAVSTKLSVASRPSCPSTVVVPTPGRQLAASSACRREKATKVAKMVMMAAMTMAPPTSMHRP